MLIAYLKYGLTWALWHTTVYCYRKVCRRFNFLRGKQMPFDSEIMKVETQVKPNGSVSCSVVSNSL